VTEPSAPDRQRSAGSNQRDDGSGAAGTSWESRAAGLAGDVQRWLIRTSAKSMRDELGDQVRRALGGQDKSRSRDNRKGGGDVWATATTEPPRAEDEPPECAWCPVCRAARRLARARVAAEADARDGAPGPDISEVVTGAIRDVLSGVDSVLSYRPGGTTEPEPGKTEPTRAEPGSSAGPADDLAEEPEDEPGYRS
jgi:hypothetical protein